MLWLDLTLILLLSLMIGVALTVAGWRRPGYDSPASGLLFLVALFFLALWAARLWLLPVGPLLWGIAWVPLVGFGLFLALVLTLGSFPRRRRRLSSKSDVVIEREPDPADATASIVLWILMIFLVVAIAVGYSA